jgi:hypothetical protein
VKTAEFLRIQLQQASWYRANLELVSLERAPVSLERLTYKYAQSARFFQATGQASFDQLLSRFSVWNVVEFARIPGAKGILANSTTGKLNTY